MVCDAIRLANAPAAAAAAAAATSAAADAAAASAATGDAASDAAAVEDRTPLVGGGGASDPNPNPCPNPSPNPNPNPNPNPSPNPNQVASWPLGTRLRLTLFERSRGGSITERVQSSITPQEQSRYDRVLGSATLSLADLIRR